MVLYQPIPVILSTLVNIWEGNNKYSNLLVSCTPWASNCTEKLYYVVVVYKNVGKNI
jgi:hypothetical protein